MTAEHDKALAELVDAAEALYWSPPNPDGTRCGLTPSDPKNLRVWNALLAVRETEKCRRCSECAGEEHHWMPIIAEVDVDEDGEFIMVPCKHCDATTMGVACGVCDDVVPAVAAHRRGDDWYCGECAPSLEQVLP